MRTGFFYWETEEYHPDNTFTLNDWLENEMEGDYTVIYRDGSYCEVIEKYTKESYSLMAGGNGDNYSHKIEIEKL